MPSLNDYIREQTAIKEEYRKELARMREAYIMEPKTEERQFYNLYDPKDRDEFFKMKGWGKYKTPEAIKEEERLSKLNKFNCIGFTIVKVFLVIICALMGVAVDLHDGIKDF